MKCPKCKKQLQKIERYDATGQDLHPGFNLPKRVKRLYWCEQCLIVCRRVRTLKKVNKGKLKENDRREGDKK